MLQPHLIQPHSDRIAVLLNANAKQVTPNVARSLAHLVGDGDLYLSRSLDEARDFTREIVRRSYPTVCTGGGDGTVANFVTDLLQSIDAENSLRPYEEQTACPTLGVLRLGTGNAVASLVGAGAASDDLKALRSGDAKCATPLSFIEAEGRLSPFIGLGLDAAIINDYFEIKDTFWGRHFKFAASILSKSIPREARGRCRTEVEVVNRGEPAVALDVNGNPVGDPILAGEVLYRGPAWIVAAGTVPYYGYNFKMFPFALDRPQRMQLRISWTGVGEMLWNLRDFWRGRCQKDIVDFACDAVSLRCSSPFPYQSAGDAFGTRTSLDFHVSPRTVDIVNHRAPVAA
ncbi:MAG: diacylglycerol kinase [Deltaproteobacteria bacterium]|nr:diacylglycerol kinase [Deltaproteobacteria bacterium]